MSKHPFFKIYSIFLSQFIFTVIFLTLMFTNSLKSPLKASSALTVIFLTAVLQAPLVS